MASALNRGRSTVKKTTRFQENAVGTLIYQIESIHLDAKQPRFSAGIDGAARLCSDDIWEPKISFADERVKKAARMLYYWNKENSLNISSYSLELLALHENRQPPQVSSVEDLLKRCMGKLTSCHHICIVYYTNYSSKRDAKTGMTPPYITDPANPGVNTLEGMIMRPVRQAGNAYFRDFYKVYPTAERARSQSRGRSRSRGRSVSRSRSKSRASRSRSRASRSRSRARSRTRSRGRSSSRGDPGLSTAGWRQAASANPPHLSMPTTDDTPDFGEELDDVVGCLKDMAHKRYTVKEVIKAGSLGKGTALEDSDIDLVVYFNGLRSIEDLKGARPTLLELIKTHVENSDFKDEVKWKRGTPYAVKFSLRGIGVDILPAFDIVEALGSTRKVYKAMEDFPGGPHKASQEFSASLVVLQRNFVKKADSRVKDVIRMLKKWSDESKVRANSYSLELLTIHFGTVYDVSDETKLFSRCMQELSSCERLRIAFDENYDSGDYTRSLSAPYILDPASPYRNTLERVDTERISRKAQKYLRSH